MVKESVEEYLARGGKINVIPTGQGKEQIRLVRCKKSTERAYYVTGATDNYNRKSESDG